MPAPKGTGLCIEKECAKVLVLAGIKDIWSKSKGQTKNKINLMLALEKALGKLSSTKIQSKHNEKLFITEGSSKLESEPEVVEEVSVPKKEESSKVKVSEKKPVEKKQVKTQPKAKKEDKKKD